jgi:hypothetical protein
MPFVLCGIISYMSPRKCIYTNKEATSKDTVIPKTCGDALHNWANRAPVNSEYQESKQSRLPTDLEMEAHRLFYLLELAKMEVSYLEARLQEVQEQITGVKQDQVDKAYHIKDLTEGFEEKAQDTLKKTTPKKIWD